MVNQPLTCGYCGKPMRAGAKFCPSCGRQSAAPVDRTINVSESSPTIMPPQYSSVPPPPTQYSPVPPPPQYQSNYPQQQPPVQQYYPPQPPVTPTPKKNSWAPFAVAGGILVVLVVVFWIAKNQNDKVKEPTIVDTLMPIISEVAPKIQTAIPEIQTKIPEVKNTLQAILPTNEAPQTTTQDVSYNGVSFSYTSQPRLAESVTSETVSAVIGLDAPPGGFVPEYTQFTFNQYAIPSAYHTPQIMVFPANQYRLLNSSAGDEVDALIDLLKNRPPKVPHGTMLPFLPIWNAAQLMHTQLAYVTFQSGEGIHYLTQYAQDSAPINNYDLFYTFQGITTDHNWYITAIFPVTHNSLPADSGVGLTDAQRNQYDTYIQEIEQNLIDQPQGFFPSLDLIDKIIQTIKITN